MQWFHSWPWRNRPDARSMPRPWCCSHCATPILGVAMGVLPAMGSAIEFSKVTVVEASNQFDVPPSLITLIP